MPRDMHIRDITNREAEEYLEKQLDLREIDLEDHPSFWLIRGIATAIREAISREKEEAYITKHTDQALDLFDDLLADVPEAE